ncbi:MAG: restriction endonuclease subunit S [Flavobacteriales bacterium]|nr:restriction endonuclease subunit S [Flavobacteriales bacterium]
MSERQVLPLSELASLHKEQENPAQHGAGLVFHFSLPAFDEGRSPKLESGSSIKSNKFTVPKDAILVSKLNPRIPRVWLPEIDASLPSYASTEFLVLRPKKGIDRRFLSYLCQSPTFSEELEQRVTGTSGSHQRVNPQDALALELEVPDHDDQLAIASVLGALDDKIELNRQTNRTLEELARALFRKWFVDEADGWEEVALEEHVQVTKGLSYKGSGLSESEGLPLHNLNAIYEGGGYKYDGVKWYTGDYKERHVLKPGDVIVANTEQGHEHLLIGCPAIVPKYFGEMGLFTHHIFRAVPKAGSPLTNHFIYLALCAPQLREQVIGYTNGTTVNGLAQDGLEKPTFPLPPAERIQQFEKIVAPLFAKKEQLHDETVTLATLRDTLLPKLMSGEVRLQG